MKIFIPTTGRAGKQKTFERLIAAGDVNWPMYLVAGKGERKVIQDKLGPVDVLECPFDGIHRVRQWILDANPAGKVVMLDDDLEFYARKANGKWPKADNGDLRRLFTAIDMALEKWAHGGVCEKFMSNHRPEQPQFNKRYFHILCYNTSLFPHPRPKFRTATGEDHDMNLQLLKAGKAGFLLTRWAHADKPWADGGCNTWRTQKVNVDACRDLADLHDDVITLKKTDKDMKNHGGTSFTMRINWRKAAQIGGLNAVRAGRR